MMNTLLKLAEGIKELINIRLEIMIEYVNTKEDKYKELSDALDSVIKNLIKECEKLEVEYGKTDESTSDRPSE